MTRTEPAHPGEQPCGEEDRRRDAMVRQRLRLLLVEDNDDLAATLTESLKALHPGWQVDLVSNLASALERIGRSQFGYDAAVVDLGLPDAMLCGEAPIRIRSVDPGLPVVVLTGNTSDRTADELIGVGVQDYLVKGQATPRQLARSVQTAIRRQALQRELTDAARRDRLTGIFNRTGLEAEFPHFERRAECTAGFFALVVCDLDRFKAVNDRYGHAVGDELLVCFSTSLTRHIRPYDVAARYGGDEFVLLVDGVPDLEHAEATGRRLANAVSADCFGKDSRFEAGASFGVALYPLHGKTLDQLVKKADAAMYAAKRRGNLISLAC